MRRAESNSAFEAQQRRYGWAAFEDWCSANQIWIDEADWQSYWRCWMAAFDLAQQPPDGPAVDTLCRRGSNDG